MYMVLKSRNYVFKMSIFKKLSIVLYSVKKVKSPCCSGGKSVNNCITAKGCQIGGFVAS